MADVAHVGDAVAVAIDDFEPDVRVLAHFEHVRTAERHVGRRNQGQAQRSCARIAHVDGDDAYRGTRGRRRAIAVVLDQRATADRHHR